MPVPYSQDTFGPEPAWGIGAFNVQRDGDCLVCGESVNQGKVFVYTDNLSYTGGQTVDDLVAGFKDLKTVLDESPCHDKCAKITAAHCPVIKRDLKNKKLLIVNYNKDSIGLHKPV
jgi:hypothetical protein